VSRCLKIDLAWTDGAGGGRFSADETIQRDCGGVAGGMDAGDGGRGGCRGAESGGCGGGWCRCRGCGGCREDPRGCGVDFAGGEEFAEAGVPQGVGLGENGDFRGEQRCAVPCAPRDRVAAGGVGFRGIPAFLRGSRIRRRMPDGPLGSGGGPGAAESGDAVRAGCRGAADERVGEEPGGHRTGARLRRLPDDFLSGRGGDGGRGVPEVVRAVSQRPAARRVCRDSRAQRVQCLWHSEAEPGAGGTHARRVAETPAGQSARAPHLGDDPGGGACGPACRARRSGGRFRSTTHG